MSYSSGCQRVGSLENDLEKKVINCDLMTDQDSTSLCEADWEAELDRLFKSFAAKIPEYEVSMAAIQGHPMRYKDVSLMERLRRLIHGLNMSVVGMRNLEENIARF